MLILADVLCCSHDLFDRSAVFLLDRQRRSRHGSKEQFVVGVGEIIPRVISAQVQIDCDP
jgi:hypothetical protein